MLKIGFLLHFYQPSTQFPEVLEKITRRAYEPLLSILEEFPEAHFTFNLTGSLLDLWQQAGREDLLDRLQHILRSGNIEVVGTAKYHPLLSKIPSTEIEFQIRLQEDSLSQNLHLPKPRGFFPPEIAYARPLAESLSRLGYSWILLDQKANPDSSNSTDITKSESVYRIRSLPLKAVFREGPLSYRIAFASIKTLKAFKIVIEPLLSSEGYIVLAMDAETFGWHRQTQLRFLKLFLKANRTGRANYQLQTISSIVNKFPQGREIEPLVSSWGNMELSDSGDRIFPRWDNPNNQVHQLQWQLLNLAISACGNDPEDSPSRQLLAVGEQSDQFWWASGNPCWLPPMVKSGAEILEKAVLTSPSASTEQKARATSLKEEIIKVGLDKFGKKPVRC